MLFYFLLFLFAFDVQGLKKPLQCPKGVRSFSAHNTRSQYYKCDHKRDAVLTECPQGKFYNNKLQRCATKAVDDYKPFDDKAMGRNVVLGALYDGRKNQIFVSRSLWDKNTIKAHKFKYDRKEVTTSFSKDSKTSDKVDKFDISADLKLDFMSGQVHVEGAMEYLTDEVSSERELNVEMLYHTTKKTETMPKYAPKDFVDECTSDATHVVTSVTYGLDANFVFKYLLSEHEKKEDIYGMVSISVTSIPGLAIHGSGSVNLSSSAQDVMSRTDLKVYGDFGDDDHTIPTDFDSACAFYADLPEMSGTAENDYFGTSILDIHLTPLTDVCTNADFILNAINDEMIASVTNMLTELEQLKIKVSGLLLRPPAEQFKPIEENLEVYKKALRDRLLQIQGDLQKIIPNIRNGTGEGEEAITELIQQYEESVFAYETSNQFLIRRNREISSVVFLMDNYPQNGDNIVIMDFESATDISVFLRKPYVIVLNLQILTPKSLTYNFLNGHEEDESGFWFNNITMNGKIGSLLRNLSNFAWENDGSEQVGYLVKLVKLEEGDPVEVLAYRHGQIEYHDFQIPSAPEQPSAYEIDHDRVKISVEKFNEFTKGVQVYLAPAFNESHITELPVEYFPEGLPSGGIMEIDIEGLEAVTLYQVTVKYYTEFGLSPPSLPSRAFLTAPSTPPQMLSVVKTTTSSIKVEWSEPEVLGTVGGSSISADDLSYRVSIKGEKGYSETQVLHNKKKATFEGVQDASNYNIEAREFLDDREDDSEHEFFAQEETTTEKNVVTIIPSNFSRLAVPLKMISISLPASTSSHSNPTTPTMVPPFPGEVGQNNITLRWEPPLRIASDAADIHYTLAYGDASADPGSWVEVDGIPGLEFLAEGLVKDQLYGIRVKIFTSVGSSQFSDILEVKTQNDIGDLGIFEDEVNDTLDDLKKEAGKKSTFCSSKSSFSGNGTITFDGLTLESNNIANANLDPFTGKFHAGADGSYMISASMEMQLYPGQTHRIWVQKDDVTIPESLMESSCNIEQFYGMSDNGSKDIVLTLKANEEVSLFHKTHNGDEPLANVLFCIQSLKVH